ncbi:MAG TPA: hypothetical protein VN673_13455 [Clostridia bacterium]|nr:hypothetical protein [Clostridia bacterium]
MSDIPFLFANAALRIQGHFGRHKEIARVFGLEPSVSCKGGTLVPGPPGFTGKVCPADVCVLTAPISSSRPLEEHLRCLMGKLAGHSSYVRELIASGARVELILTLTSEQNKMDFTIDPALIRAIADLGTPIVFSATSLGTLWAAAGGGEKAG